MGLNRDKLMQIRRSSGIENFLGPYERQFVRSLI